MMVTLLLFGVGVGVFAVRGWKYPMIPVLLSVTYPALFGFCDMVLRVPLPLSRTTMAT